MKVIIDEKYHFATFFNPQNGMYVRTGILDENGCDTSVEPVRASFPHLVDVGVMGHCTHGLSGKCKKLGINCYQQGGIINRPNMSLNTFRNIVKQCENRSFQFALGGRGDPNEHEEFEKILLECRKHEIVPNYTTSGFGLTERQIELSSSLCGRVAVSWYGADNTIDAIERFFKKKQRVNIHFVITSTSLPDAIDLLRNRFICEKVAAIIFLLYKPVGDINKDQIVPLSHPLLPHFFEQVVISRQYVDVGFDSCFVPILLQHSFPLDLRSIEPCESGRFSCYISESNKMYPCSFIQDERFSYSLDGHSIEDVWNSEKFDRFLCLGEAAECRKCIYLSDCRGGCPGIVSINQCRRKENDR